jgi:hypothetical protein
LAGSANQHDTGFPANGGDTVVIAQDAQGTRPGARWTGGLAKGSLSSA